MTNLRKQNFNSKQKHINNSYRKHNRIITQTKRTDLLKHIQPPTNRDKREQKHLFINKVKFMNSKQKGQVISHRFLTRPLFFLE